MLNINWMIFFFAGASGTKRNNNKKLNGIRNSKSFFRIKFQHFPVMFSNEWFFVFGQWILIDWNRRNFRSITANVRSIYSFIPFGSEFDARWINNNAFLETSPFKSHSLYTKYTQTSVIVNNVFIKLFKVVAAWSGIRAAHTCVRCLIHKYLTNKFPV